MCSIEGFTGKHSFSIEEYSSYNKNRGPDGTNYFTDESVSIGHSLLQISPNPNQIQQPYVNSKGCVLSYNGELYGYGDEFDTLILNNMLENTNNGKDIKDILSDNVDGMWGFSYYDPHQQTVTLCRDHFGVKPLYYMILDRQLFWSSTVRPLIAVLKHYDQYSVNANSYTYWDRINDGWILSPKTMYHKICLLPPGMVRTWDIKLGEWKNNFSLWQSYDLHPDYDWEPEEYKELAEKKLREACYAPGVPKGLSLSGGLDSTLLASLNKDDPDLSVFITKFIDWQDFEGDVAEKQFGEQMLATKTAEEFGLKYHYNEVDKNYEELQHDTYEKLLSPIWNPERTVPRHLNIQKAFYDNKKIFFTGDCADEIFTGYNGHDTFFGGGLKREWGGKLKLYTDNDLDPSTSNWFIHSHVYGTDAGSNLLFQKLMFSVDSFCLIQDHLCGTYGIESRVPYLTQTLAKYVMKIPLSNRFRLPTQYESRNNLTAIKTSRIGQPGEGVWTREVRGTYKWLIREEMKDYLPDHVRKDKSKVGYSVPWNARNGDLNRRKTMNVRKIVARNAERVDTL